VTGESIQGKISPRFDVADEAEVQEIPAYTRCSGPIHDRPTCLRPHRARGEHGLHAAELTSLTLTGFLTPAGVGLQS